jgi:alpha-glucosidase
MIHPELASLPVFVHAGSILPIAPLVQSVYETPRGPLTLRIYAGTPCEGELYLDDGNTYAFQNGAYLRTRFTCDTTDDSFHLHVTAHEGSYLPWWKEIRAEVYGWTPKRNEIIENGKTNKLVADPSGTVTFTVPDNAKGLDIELK